MGDTRDRRAWGAHALALALTLTLACAGGLGAQALDDLRTPPSPGFTILGIQPSAIERPTTPTALAFGLFSATGRGTVLPGSYALEIAPYWLTPKPLLTFSEAYRPTFWQGVKQTFALSLATDRGEEDGDSTRLGAGFRVQLLSGRPTPRADAVEDTLRALAAAQRRTEDAIDTLTEARDADLIASLRARSDGLDAEAKRLRRDFGAMRDAGRAGVRWELAGAMALAFPTTTFENGDMAAWGFWTTLSMRPTAAKVDVLLLLRFQEVEALRAMDPSGQDLNGEAQRVLDAGARVLLGSGNLVASAELLGRTAFDVEGHGEGAVLLHYHNSWRLAASFEYRFSERASLTWTFGRGFALAGADAGELVSLLGVRWAPGSGLELPFR